MQNMTNASTNGENAYKHTITCIGGAMLIFLVLINVLVSTWSIFDMLLHELLNEMVANIIGQLSYAIVYLASFMLPALFLKLMLGKKYRPMMLDKTLTRDAFLYIFAGIAIIFAFAYLNSVVLDPFGFSNITETLLESEKANENYQVVLMFITLAIVPGICEEFLFRGAVLSNLRPFGKGPAIIISAVLFGLMHQNPGQFLYATVAGLLLGWLAYETGSIWCGMLLHFLNNFISIVQQTVSERLSEQMANFALTAMELMLFGVGIVCAVVIILKHERKKHKKKLLSEGLFGIPLNKLIDEEAPSVRLAPHRASSLFFMPTMTLFTVLCGLNMILIFILSIFMSVVSYFASM